MTFTSFVDDIRLRNGSGVCESERVYDKRDAMRECWVALWSQAPKRIMSLSD